MRAESSPTRAEPIHKPRKKGRSWLGSGWGPTRLPEPKGTVGHAGVQSRGGPDATVFNTVPILLPDEMTVLITP